MTQTPLSILTILLLVLAGLFLRQQNPVGKRLFNVVPLLVFCYFVPALLSNLGVIPTESELYVFIRRVLLPASLVLLVLSTDIPAVMSLGRDAGCCFLPEPPASPSAGRWRSWRWDGCSQKGPWIRRGAASRLWPVPGLAAVPISLPSAKVLPPLPQP